MIQIHIASAIHQNREVVVLNRKERGTIESESRSGYERVEKKKSPPSCQSLFTSAGKINGEKHSSDAETSEYIQVRARSPTADLTRFQWEKKTGEVERVMVRAPGRLACMVECALVKVP